MKLSKILRTALNIIIHSRLRSWLTIIGIIIGVASVIAIISIGNGFETSIQDQFGAFGTNTVIILPGFDKAYDAGSGPPPFDLEAVALTNKEVQTVKSIPEIDAVSADITESTTVYYLGESANIAVTGTDPKVWSDIATVEIDKGRLLAPGDRNAIVIGSNVADGLFDSKVSLNRQLKINGKSFRVVGVLEEAGSFGAYDREIFMPITQGYDTLDKPQGEFDKITVRVGNIDDVERTVDLIERKLMIVRHVTDDTRDFTVISMKATQEKIGEILQGFTMFLGVIAAISLLVGAVGIANTMFTSVLEKTKEIGVMKALGAKNSDILLIFLINSGMVGLVGGILGTLFGVMIALAIPAAGFSFGGGSEPFQTEVTAGLIIFSLLFSMIIGMIAGAIPAYRASKENPVDALRYE
jgi:putative ABC transport system permease protein